MANDRPGPQPRVHLAEARMQHGWSQQEVAELIGTTYVNVSRWERGVTRPSPYYRKKLGALYGKTEQELELTREPLNAHEAQELNSAVMAVPLPSALPLTPFVVPGALYDPSIPSPPTIHLVGRDEILKTLRTRLQNTLSMTALNGLPGVGKTTLLMTLANDPMLRQHFNDGVLWAGLGPQPNMQAHLSRWGALLGLSSDEMSALHGLDAWAMALRRMIGSRRMLLVIDDTWSSEDALLLKVGGPNCAHLVSTRSPFIATQLAADGAMPIRELTVDEGMLLLRMLAPQVIDDEPQRARELVLAVDGLPLGLNLMGNYLRMQAYTGQTRRIAAALQKLKEASERLTISELRGPVERHPSLPGDVPVSLRSVIAVTDQQLAEPNREALHALATFQPRPNSFSEEAALAVAACNEDMLDRLTDTGLLESSGPVRYSLHSTISDYIRQQPANPEVPLRLSAYMTGFVDAQRKNYEALEVESTNVLTALDIAHEQERPAELIGMACNFAPFLLSRGRYAQAETYLQHAYTAAQAQSDHSGMAGALLYLGEVAQRQGNYPQAEEYLLEGMGYARGIDHHDLICAILNSLGTVCWKTGRHALAEEYLQEGLDLARKVNNLERLCGLLATLGAVNTNQGSYAQAEADLQEGLTIAQQIEDREQICTILLVLGLVAGAQGNYQQAEIYFQEGLVIARQLGHSERISGLLNNLGDIASEQGNYKQARQYFLEGLEIAQQIGHYEWTSLLLLNLGIAARMQANYEQAEQYFGESLVLSRQIGIPQIICNILYEYGNLCLDQHQPEAAESRFREMHTLVPKGSKDLLALVQYGLARVLTAQGNILEGRRYGEASLEILEEIGHRSAHEVKRWLDTQ